MNPSRTVEGSNPLASLRRLARPAINSEICEFCSLPLAARHRHLLELSTRKIICSCDACALRFDNGVGARWKLVPREGVALPGLRLTDEQWESFALPINLAFIHSRTPGDKVVAFYPSPAGPTESLLALSSWKGLVAANPRLETMQPDVEALLLNRLGPAREYYIAPIDACYELVGLIRLHWRGLSGGEKVWRHIDEFFARLKSESQPAADLPVEVAHG